MVIFLYMNHFKFSGFDTVELAKEYGTPLYVISQDIFEDKVNSLKKAFEKEDINYHISFAGKSLLNLAIAKLVDSLDIGLDTASKGEVYTALAAGFNPEEITFHGNNKSEEELSYAIDKKVGRIVVDSISEIKRLKKLLENTDATVNVLLRVNPGVDAHTNELINTGKTDTKFGIPFDNVNEALELLKDEKNINLVGLHSHIGSQIIEEEPFIESSKKVLALYSDIKKDFPELNEINLGGGFGIAYTQKEEAFDPSIYIPKLIKGLKQIAENNNIELPLISIEPGRFISAESGITLYTVGTIKEIPDIRTYISVDGGMADNPRPALYDAEYEAVICNRPLTEENKKKVTVSGKACETDTLIKNIYLADPKEGDFLAILKTGAYNYTMSSNYNRFLKPAMVLLKGEDKNLIVEREDYSDLIRHEKIPRWLEEE